MTTISVHRVLIHKRLTRTTTFCHIAARPIIDVGRYNAIAKTKSLFNSIQPMEYLCHVSQEIHAALIGSMKKSQDTIASRCNGSWKSIGIAPTAANDNDANVPHTPTIGRRALPWYV